MLRAQLGENPAPTTSSTVISKPRLFSPGGAADVRLEWFTRTGDCEDDIEQAVRFQFVSKPKPGGVASTIALEDCSMLRYGNCVMDHMPLAVPVIRSECTIPWRLINDHEVFV